MKKDTQLMLMLTLLTSYLAQIHTTLIEIMGRVGEGKAISDAHNQVIMELQKEQAEIIKKLNSK